MVASISSNKSGTFLEAQNKRTQTVSKSKVQSSNFRIWVFILVSVDKSCSKFQIDWLNSYQVGPALPIPLRTKRTSIAHAWFSPMRPNQSWTSSYDFYMKQKTLSIFFMLKWLGKKKAHFLITWVCGRETLIASHVNLACKKFEMYQNILYDHSKKDWVD